MFCPNCGTQMEDGVRFCPACGQEISQPESAQPVYVQPEVQAISPALASSILKNGILAIIFGCTVWLSFLGIIFGAIGRGRAKSVLYAGEVLYGKAKVGSILSKVGLILGIIFTVFMVIWLLIIFMAALA